MPRRSELVFVALLLFGACTARAPVAVPPAPPRPLDESAIHTIAQLLQMQDRRVLDAGLVRSALAHPRTEVRLQAALAAGRTGDRDAAGMLRSALADSVQNVAATVAFALGELGDSTDATANALISAALPTGWDRRSVAVEAVHALGKLRMPRAGDVLTQALQENAPPEVTAEALLSIWRLPRTAVTVAAVASRLQAEDPELRWRAAYALMRMADPATMGALIAALGDDDHRVRELAARALRASPVDSAGERAAAMAALRDALADSHPHVTINAARALASYADPANTAVLALLLGAVDANVAIAAAQALGDQGDRAAALPLATLARDPMARLALRATALASHARLEPAAAAIIASEWAAHGDWLTRTYAARALAGVAWAHAAPALGRLARDRDPRVAAEAVAAIAASTDTLGAGYAFFIEGLGSSDVMVRAAALRALGARPTAGELPVLLDAYARAEADSLTDAALAAIQALGALKEAGSPVERTFFMRFSRSPNALVRQAVGRLLGDDWGSALPVETGRSATDYVDVIRTLVAPTIAGEPPPAVRIRTERGDIVVTLAPVEAPLTVANMLALVEAGFYSGPNLRWHRVVPNFVLQDGDPRGDGSGGPAHAIRDEMNRLRYERGMLGMALSGPDTGGSQFFITHSPQPHLDGGYTVFGRVSAGMDVADAIVQDDRILAIEVAH